MSRQRIRTGVLEGSSVPCPHCAGAGIVRAVPSVALHVLRAVEEMLSRATRITCSCAHGLMWPSTSSIRSAAICAGWRTVSGSTSRSWPMTAHWLSRLRHRAGRTRDKSPADHRSSVQVDTVLPEDEMDELVEDEVEDEEEEEERASESEQPRRSPDHRREGRQEGRGEPREGRPRGPQRRPVGSSRRRRRRRSALAPQAAQTRWPWRGQARGC